MKKNVGDKPFMNKHEKRAYKFELRSWFWKKIGIDGDELEPISSARRARLVAGHIRVLFAGILLGITFGVFYGWTTKGWSLAPQLSDLKSDATLLNIDRRDETRRFDLEKSDLKKQIQVKSEQLDAAKTDLEKQRQENLTLNVKLAPLAAFDTIANQRFAADPPDKRIDLLLEEVKKISDRLPLPRRMLSADSMERIRSLLPAGVPDPSLIEYAHSMTDTEALALTEQISKLFSGDRAKISSNLYSTSGDGKRAGIYLRSALPERELQKHPLMPALIQLHKELGYEGMRVFTNQLTTRRGERSAQIILSVGENERNKP